MLYIDYNKDTELQDTTLYLGSIYLHGSLQKEAGYDILRTDSIFLYNKIYNWHHKDDKFNCQHKLELMDGRAFEVDMFVWKNKSGKMIGLVCDINDIESLRYCTQAYKSKVEMV